MHPREAPREYAGDGIVVTWEPARCQHAAECVRGLPTVFDTAARPWIDPSRASADEIVEVVDRCPSHALGYRTADGRTRSAPAD
ncbi:(4Fe-4S)-binding protein [Nocardioides sp. WV_118_6]|uniref:(4Fe-4S)-binding protein n=1 Tax=Nocardioides simplex TaxID=2045 RepID=UPI00215067F9|nr:(4Fe-4S)-binding protein [Pimelobacter simplex]UUW92391.1 (4Fe-4S)-binding protein [Pimelobacter simplex]UUW96219.1 (4Fe-4S)-binding protein [Pimelobacter simplex]